MVAAEPATTVRIYNTNTDKLLVAHVPVAGGKARVRGDCAIAGVPGTGAEIIMDYSATIGARTGRLLPTGNVVDIIALEDGRTLEATVCDVANPCVFVAASELGLDGGELAPDISADRQLIEAIGEAQAKVGERVGLWNDWRAVHLPGLPLFVIVAPPADYVDATGAMVPSDSMDLRARLVFFGKCHDSMAGTGSMCTAAASRVPGSVVHRAIGPAAAKRSHLRLGHPLGVMDVKVVAAHAHQPDSITFETLGLA